MIYGQAACLLGYFQEQLTKNPSFQYGVQLDNIEHITNVFWVDARMVINNVNFGDVVTFDTTYGPNKELRPLGVLTDFNHHRVNGFWDYSFIWWNSGIILSGFLKAF